MPKETRTRVFADLSPEEWELYNKMLPFSQRAKILRAVIVDFLKMVATHEHGDILMALVAAGKISPFKKLNVQLTSLDAALKADVEANEDEPTRP